MNVSRRHLIALAAAGVFQPLVARADTWPTKAVRFVVPAPPGGSFDVIARLLAEQLGKEISQPVVVDNKPGAGGWIAGQYMAGAAPDGHTLLVTGSNVLTETAHLIKPPLDPMKDLRSLAPFARLRFVVVTAPDLPVKDMAGFAAYLKANPGKTSFASSSLGTLSHFFGEMLNQRLGTDMTHVPFAGAPPAAAAVMGHNSTVFLDNVVTAMPLLRAGKTRALGISGAVRHPQLPEVPTLQEQGFPEFVNFVNWQTLVMSRKVPAPVAEHISALFRKIAAASEFKARVLQLGFEPAEAMSDEQFAKRLQEDHAWAGEFGRKLKLS